MKFSVGGSLFTASFLSGSLIVHLRRRRSQIPWSSRISISLRFSSTPLLRASVSRYDKKLDISVLRIQNLKHFQQLEAQKVKYFVFEDKYKKLKKQQEIYGDTVAGVNNSWEQLVTDLESRSICTIESTNTGHDLQAQVLDDGAFIPIQYDFLSRLLKTGATESCSYCESAAQMEFDMQLTIEATKNILQNIISSINWMWHGSENVNSSLQATFSEDGMQLQKSVGHLRIELRSLIVGVNDLHFNHRLLASDSQIHRDVDAELKAEKKHLIGELASTKLELEEINSELASLKAQRDGSNVAPIHFSKLGNIQSGVDMARNELREIQHLTALLNEVKDLAASSMVEISNLHERKIEILKKLVSLKNVLVDLKSISSSIAFLILKDQLDKSKMEMDQCRILLEKLQVEDGNVLWHEKEVNAEVNMAVISGKICEFSKSRIAELEQELPKFVQDRSLMETKLEETLGKPGRKEIIADFKELVSLLTTVTEAIQNELGKLKDSFSEIHSLRTQVQFLSVLLQREAEKLQPLFDKSAGHLQEINNLHLAIGDLGEREQDLNLFYEMYRCESTDSWEVMESLDVDYKAWAYVRSLKSSLDVHNLESRVKAAIEAEAKTQQRLATAEAEIANLRQKLELSVRQIVTSSEKLKSKHDEVESYCSEIESIGKAYEDLQIESQHLFREILERDEHKIKLVMEDVKTRQLHDADYREIKNMDKKVQEAHSLIHLYDPKGLWFDEELKVCSGQVAKLADVGQQSSVALRDAQRRLSDVYTESQELRHSLNEMQIQAEKSRLEVTELLIELARERFNKRRTNERSEPRIISVAFRKLLAEGSADVLERLQQEISEYREILNCPMCHERQKEVVIAKCFHLFCKQCIERFIGNRRRPRCRHKCPTCSANFGPNDVKPVSLWF